MAVVCLGVRAAEKSIKLPDDDAMAQLKPGPNVGIGSDDTLFAKIPGIVRFEDKGNTGRFISIQPVE